MSNLQKLKIINKKYKKIKLLGPGELKDKLNIEVNAISKSAKAKIEKVGGKGILHPRAASRKVSSLTRLVNRAS